MSVYRPAMRLTLLLMAVKVSDALTALASFRGRESKAVAVPKSTGRSTSATSVLRRGAQKKPTRKLLCWSETLLVFDHGKAHCIDCT